MLYSDKYLKGKHGVILVVDGSKFPPQTGKNPEAPDPYDQLQETIDTINKNLESPVSLIVNKCDILDEMYNQFYSKQNDRASSYQDTSGTFVYNTCQADSKDSMVD